MKPREARQLLLEAGGKFIRRGSKHELWQLGDKLIPLSSGSNVSPRTIASFKSIIARHKRGAVVTTFSVPGTVHETITPAVAQEKEVAQMNPHPVPPPRGAVKFSREDREKLRSRLKELLASGMSTSNMLMMITQEGFKTPSGKAPDEHFVSNQLGYIRKENERRKPKTLPKVSKPKASPQATPVTKVTTRHDALEEAILTEPGLSNDKIVALLRILRS